MDDSTFDQLTRAWASGMPRRAFLRDLAAGAASIMAVLAGCGPSGSTSGSATPTATKGAATATATGGTGTGTDPTLDSLNQAAAAIAQGGTDVPITPAGNVRFQRTLSGTTVTHEQILSNGNVVVSWDYTATSVAGKFSPTSDGFYLVQLTATPASGSTGAYLQRTTFAPDTKAPTFRETYQQDGTTVHVQWEEPDDSGTLQVTETFDTDLGQGAYFAGVPALGVYAPAATCTPDQLNTLQGDLANARFKGLQCLRNLDPNLADRFQDMSLRQWGFQCTSLGPNSCARNPSWQMTPNTPLTIQIDPGCFFGKTTDLQQEILFHELMHSLLGPHQFDCSGGDSCPERQAPVDPVQSCAALCFEGGDKCACASCLKTNKCDKRCAPYADCGKQSYGGICPCPQPKYYASYTTCTVECPTGLKCFAAQCKQIDFACPQ